MLALVIGDVYWDGGFWVPGRVISVISFCAIESVHMVRESWLCMSDSIKVLQQMPNLNAS